MLSIDLTGIGGIVAQYEFEVETDDVDRIDGVVIHLNGLSIEQMGRLMTPDGLRSLKGQLLTGTLVDGRNIRTTLNSAYHVIPTASDSVDLSCYVGPTILVPGSIHGASFGGRWEFDLANVALHVGDVITTRSASANTGPSANRGMISIRNRVCFTIGGRAWSLTDELMDNRQQLTSAHLRRPLRSAILATDFQPTDVAEDIEQIATDIDTLLSFALNHGIRWIVRRRFDGNGQLIEEHTRNVWLPPFGTDNPKVVDNWEFFNLRDFMQTCYAPYVADREWLVASLDLYLQSQMNKFLSVRASMLNVLLDRLKQHVVPATNTPEIDEHLNERLDKRWFNWLLNRLLRLASRNWSIERTNALIETIKQWNAGPSFPKGVRRACELLRLPNPRGRMLQTRHRVIHVGVVDLPLEQAIEYLMDLEHLVLTMLLRVMQYEGVYYHSSIGTQPARLGDRLTQLPNPAVEETQ
jgi:hypothetical protein